MERSGTEEQQIVSMELTQADQKQIADWLGAKCGAMRCKCCGYMGWQIVPLAMLPIVVDLHSTRFFYSAGQPLVGVTCTNCGHVLFFNPAVIGIKPDVPATAEVPGATPGE